MKISNFIQHPRTEQCVVAVIVANAAILTAETMVDGQFLAILKVLDTACLIFFVLEILLRLVAAAEPDHGKPWQHRPLLALRRFTRNGWNIFDVFATLAAFVPGLNALRTLRLLRLIAQIPMFRATVEDLLHACQRTLPLIMLAALLLFVGALTGVLAFGQLMPELFGNLAIALITMFGLMLSDNVGSILGNMYQHHALLAVFFALYTLILAVLIISLVVSIVIDVAQARLRSKQSS